MDVSTESTDVHRNTCTYVSTLKTVVCGITYVYNNYDMNGPKLARIKSGREHMGIGAVGKILEGSDILTCYIARGFCRYI